MSSRKLAALVLSALMLASLTWALYWLLGGFPSGFWGSGAEAYEDLNARPDVLEYWCGDTIGSPDGQEWCVFLYRNFTLGVTRNGLTVYTVGRETVLAMLLKPERQTFKATLNETQDYIIQLICDNPERYSLYCQVGFLHPGTGQLYAASAGILTYSYEVLEAASKLQKPPTTLNGTLYALDGETLAEQLWSKMAEYRAGDDRVGRYVTWLREVISGVPLEYSSVFDNYEWSRWGFTPPEYSGLVRIGRVELPFGVGLIVTAYTAGSGASVVVHATITNMEEWLELLARLRPYPPHPDEVNMTQEWVLWRIRLPSGATYIVQDDGTVVRVNEVAVLLEMPVYTYYYLVDRPYGQEVLEHYQLLKEYVYWTLVHPAFATAIRIASPPYENLWELYTWYGTEFARGVALHRVRHPGDSCDVEPGCGISTYTVRLMGWGQCVHQSVAAATVASNALGAFTVYIQMTRLGHAVAVLANATNPDIDYDKDGTPESTVLVDTARLKPTSIINDYNDGALTFPPFLAIHVRSSDNVNNPVHVEHEFRYFYYLSGVIDAMLSLPPWLRAPWTDALLEQSRFHEELAKSVAIIESRLIEPPWSLFRWNYWLKKKGIAKDTMTLEDAIHYSLQTYKEYAEKHGWTPPPSHEALADTASHIPQLHKTPTPPPREPGKG